MFKKTDIGKGITFLSEHIPYVHSVSLGIWVKSGSISDEKRTMGMGHFVEHMLFKGTEKRSAFQIAKEIDDVGGNLNAYTSKEYTNFYVKVLKEDVALGVDVLCDLFVNPTFPEGELKKEKGVVIQEIKMVEDAPDDYIHDLSFKTMWGDHPLGYSILGEEKTVKSITRQSLIDYRAHHHTQENIIVGAVGNFDHGTLAGLLERRAGRRPEGKARADGRTAFCGQDRRAAPGYRAGPPHHRL